MFCGRLPGVPPEILTGHMINRRGIPFGPELTVLEEAEDKTHQDRGLAFVCYQSNIADGFEFMQESKPGADPVLYGRALLTPRVATGWSNAVDFAPNKPVNPGFDPISTLSYLLIGSHLTVCRSSIRSRPGERRSTRDDWPAGEQSRRADESPGGVCRLKRRGVLLHSLVDGVEDQVGGISCCMDCQSPVARPQKNVIHVKRCTLGAYFMFPMS